MLDLLRSPRKREVHRLSRRGHYAELLFQCGYDSVQTFREILDVLKGEPGKYDRLLDFRGKDIGVLETAVMTRIDPPKDPSKLSEQLQRDLFGIGFEELAYEHGLTRVADDLSDRGFDDPVVYDKVAGIREPRLTKDGIIDAVQNLRDFIEENGIRDAYVRRRTDDIRHKIRETEQQALDAVKDKLGDAANYADVLALKRRELKAPYEVQLDNLESAFDQDLDTATQHLEEKNYGKAISMLKELGYKGEREIKKGLKIALERKESLRVLAQLLQHIHVDRKSLENNKAALFYRWHDQSFAVLVMRGKGTFVYQGKESLDSLKHVCNIVLNDLQTWEKKKPADYSSMENQRREFYIDALGVQHREHKD